MRVKSFLKKVANIVPSDIPGDDGLIYVSKFDGSYVTRVGMEKDVKFLASREITEQLTHGVGFSLRDGKWYGWSHRAIYGFSVGSKCNKGDCHYFPASKEDFIDSTRAFWEGENHSNVKAYEGAHEDGTLGVFVEWAYDSKTPNEKIRGEFSSIFTAFPGKYGRGEWTAKTPLDAKQMAIDFNAGVS